MKSKVNRSYFTILIGYIVYFLLGFGLILFYYYKSDNGNIATTLTFIHLFILMFVSAFVRNRLTFLRNLRYSIMIQEHSGDPIKVKKVHNPHGLFSYLKADEFIKFNNDSSHYLYYKVSKDPIKKTFSLYMLEVVVYINKNESDFYLDIVDEEINKIKDEQLEKGIKINRLFITQIKSVEELDDDTKQKIVENVFLRTRHNIISTINVAVLDGDLAVFLYSDNYSPSLYYDYHLSKIKELI